MSMTVTGLREIQQNLAREVRRIKGRTKRGLLQAAAVVKRSSVRNAPIDLGNLRSSHYIYWPGGSVPVPAFSGKDEDDTKRLIASHNAEVARAQQDIHGFSVRVGASAYYAIFVHEMPATNNFNSGGPKFLQRAVTQNEAVILRLIAENARIPT